MNIVRDALGRERVEASAPWLLMWKCDITNYFCRYVLIMMDRCMIFLGCSYKELEMRCRCSKGLEPRPCHVPLSVNKVFGKTVSSASSCMSQLFSLY